MDENDDPLCGFGRIEAVTRWLTNNLTNEVTEACNRNITLCSKSGVAQGIELRSFLPAARPAD